MQEYFKNELLNNNTLTYTVFTDLCEDERIVFTYINNDGFITIKRTTEITGFEFEELNVLISFVDCLAKGIARDLGSTTNFKRYFNYKVS